WDGAHEDPSAFSEAAGRDLTRLPATMELLTTIQDEVERVVTAAKIHFARPRPNQVDPTLPSCAKPKAELRGYPSGHAGFGWAAAWTLARLMPDRAIALLARAQDYALSRELCGTHFSFDVEASHPLGVLAAELMLADP
ncbi:phosphatase PAP2 family protein, partial [Mycobacterium tuberculosis]